MTGAVLADRRSLLTRATLSLVIAFEYFRSPCTMTLAEISAPNLRMPVVPSPTGKVTSLRRRPVASSFRAMTDQTPWVWTRSRERRARRADDLSVPRTLFRVSFVLLGLLVMRLDRAA